MLPAAGLQFFGKVDVDGLSEIMIVSSNDIKDDVLYRQALNPEV